MNKSSWKIKKLGEVSNILMGQSPSSDFYNTEEKGLPFYQGNADFGKLHPIVRTYCTHPIRIAEARDILISVRAPIGAINIALGRCCIGRGLASIRAIKNKTIYKYIYYCLFFYKEKLISLGTGSTFKAINKNILTDLNIQIPPIDIQKQIVKELDTLSDIITKKKEQLAELDKLAQAIFYDMFGDLETNEKNWKAINFAKIITILTDYHANGSYEILRDNVTLLNSPNYALMVRTTDLEKNSFGNDCIFIDEKAYNFLDKSKIFGGEIIINKIGSAGKVYLMPYLDRPATLGMNAFLIRTDSSKIKNIYLYYYLTSHYGFKIINQNVKGAVTKTITKEAVRNLPLLLPSLSLQNQFAEKIEAIEQQKALINKSITDVQLLFDYTMDKYFN